MPSRLRGPLRVRAFAAKLSDGFFERRQALRVDEFQKAEFEMQTLIGLAAQIVFGSHENIEEAREIFLGELRGLLG